MPAPHGRGAGIYAPAMDIARVEDRTPFITKDGSEIRELAGLPTGNAVNQSLAHATVAARSATDAHYHPVAEEIYLFVSGAGRMRLGDDESPVAAGDCVVIPPGTEHQLVNDDAREPLVLFCCCSPAYRHEDTVITRPAAPAG